MNDVVRVYFPHANLGCLGFRVCGFYFDLSLPHREGWGGLSWRSLVRLYWRWGGKRYWLYLPSLYHVTRRG